MNLFKLHTSPTSLDLFEPAHQVIPSLFWDKYVNQPDEIASRLHLIARSPQYALKYAVEILKGPFQEGEPAIATDATSAYTYSREILGNERFKLGEKAIASESGIAYLYAKNIIKGAFPEGEAAIATDTDNAYVYAVYVIKKRFETGEPAIAKDAETSVMYAENVLKGKPFKLGEPAIATSEEFAQEYADMLGQDFIFNGELVARPQRTNGYDDYDYNDDYDYFH